MTDRELNPVLVSVAAFLGDVCAYIAAVPYLLLRAIGADEEAEAYGDAVEAWLDRIAE